MGGPTGRQRTAERSWIRHRSDAGRSPVPLMLRSHHSRIPTGDRRIMTLIGDLERFFASIIWPNRLPFLSFDIAPPLEVYRSAGTVAHTAGTVSRGEHPSQGNAPHLVLPLPVGSWG